MSVLLAGNKTHQNLLILDERCVVQCPEYSHTHVTNQFIFSWLARIGHQYLLQKNYTEILPPLAGAMTT